LSTDHTTKYRQFHQKGRWQGLPTRVEETGEPPRFQPAVGVAGRPGIEVLALELPNQGMMEGQPTNCFLLGYVGDAERRLTLVDTGTVENTAALEGALAAAEIGPERIGLIVLTHTHPDHVGGAAALQREIGAPVWAHPLEREQIERWGNGVRIDGWIEDGAPLVADGFALEPIFTPGHSPGHVCLVDSCHRVLLAGDMISGFGSVGIFPPSGSMVDYIASLRRLLAKHEESPFSAVLPGHGPAIADAGAKIREYITHRLERDEEVYNAVAAGRETLDVLLPAIYPDVLPHLSWAARSTLQAHLDKLVDDGRVIRQGDHYSPAD
jgi:glyoxylase-like metal-dependent hydrolase (beta-lactamase superfamily II)